MGQPVVSVMDVKKGKEQNTHYPAYPILSGSEWELRMHLTNSPIVLRGGPHEGKTKIRKDRWIHSGSMSRLSRYRQKTPHLYILFRLALDWFVTNTISECHDEIFYMNFCVHLKKNCWGATSRDPYTYCILIMIIFWAESSEESYNFPYDSLRQHTHSSCTLGPIWHSAPSLWSDRDCIRTTNGDPLCLWNIPSIGGKESTGVKLKWRCEIALKEHLATRLCLLINLSVRGKTTAAYRI